MAIAHNYGIEAVTESIPGFRPVRIFGLNSSIGTSETFVGNVGGSAPHMPSSAKSIEIVSSSEEDAVSGAGMRSVHIKGVNSTYELIDTVVQLNGTTPVTVPGTWFRIYAVCGFDAGTYGASNTGTITVREVSWGTSFAVVLPGQGQAHLGHYFVPKNHLLAVFSIHISDVSSKPTDFRLYQRQRANKVTAPFFAKRLVNSFDGVGGFLQINYYTVPILFHEYTDVWAVALVSNSTTSTAVEINGILKEYK